MDNALEFHSEALQRGCEGHGIALQHRPVRQPHYGGTVERVLGTLMHRDSTDCQAPPSPTRPPGASTMRTAAASTLGRTRAVAHRGDHRALSPGIHRGLGAIPLKHYTVGILGTPEVPGRGYPPKIRDLRAFLIDFLPFSAAPCSGTVFGSIILTTTVRSYGHSWLGGAVSVLSDSP